MDPSDVLDFEYLFGELDYGETIATFTVLADPDSATLGLVVGTASRAPALVTRTVAGVDINGVSFWLSINTPQQSNTAFDAGITMGVVIKIVTSASPSRTYERTMAVLVSNK